MTDPEIEAIMAQVPTDPEFLRAYVEACGVSWEHLKSNVRAIICREISDENMTWVACAFMRALLKAAPSPEYAP